MSGALLPGLLAAVAGMAAGWLHFRSLRPVTDRLLRGELSAVALQVGRLALLAGFLILCTRAGPGPLLGAAAGVMAGRALALRQEKAR